MDPVISGSNVPGSSGDQLLRSASGSRKEPISGIYRGRFNAGFRLGSVPSVNNRGGSSASYSVLINNVAVALSADDGPSFKNTLSAGDRNALALAFFFASLDQDARLAENVVVIDDPMTSLDEHRRLTTFKKCTGYTAESGR